MTCEDLRPEYDAFALGIADDPERSEIREHLERRCPVCVPGVADAMATVAAMTGAVKLTDPPRHLRQRVSALVMPPPARSSPWLPWLITGIVSVALILVARPARRPAAELARLEAALAILDDPNTRDVSFGETQKPSRGRVLFSPGHGVVFIGAAMPRLAVGHTFELWLIPASGNPIPAGTFPANDDASAVYVRTFDNTTAAAVAVTVEPDGGSPQPTTTPFIVAKL
jgi:hypothetical protein